MNYNYVIQEKNGVYWFDLYNVYDRKQATMFLNIMRRKYPNNFYRCVRLIQ